jgi:hypothetical protein
MKKLYAGYYGGFTAFNPGEILSTIIPVMFVDAANQEDAWSERIKEISQRKCRDMMYLVSGICTVKQDLLEEAVKPDRILMVGCYGAFLTNGTSGMASFSSGVAIAPTQESAITSIYEILIDSLPPSKGYRDYRVDFQVVPERLIQEILHD